MLCHQIGHSIHTKLPPEDFGVEGVGPNAHVLAKIGPIPGGSDSTESVCQCQRSAFFRSLGQEDPLEKGVANPLHYSCLEHPLDRGAWQAAVHGVSKSWTRLSD